MILNFNEFAIYSKPSTIFSRTMEKNRHLKYLNEFRTTQCPLFLEQQCQNHRPYTCFYWHFPNQKRRRPLKRPDGTFNYNPDVYCDKYDENAGTCPDANDCPYAHRNAGDTERRYHPRYFKTGNCIYETTETGACVKNGLHCAFAHGPDDLRLPVYDIREVQDSSSKVTVNLPASLEKERVLSEDPKWNEMRHVMSRYKTELCKKPPRMCRQGYSCPYYHNGKDKRRMPDRYHYRSTPCPAVRPGDEWLDSSQCDSGDACIYCHTRTEQQFHPEIYKSSKCNDVLNSGYCPRGPFCAFAHDDSEMMIGRDYLTNLQQFYPLCTVSATTVTPSATGQLQQQQQQQLSQTPSTASSSSSSVAALSPPPPQQQHHFLHRGLHGDLRLLSSTLAFSPPSSVQTIPGPARSAMVWPPCTSVICPATRVGTAGTANTGLKVKGRHLSGGSIISESHHSTARDGTPPFVFPMSSGTSSSRHHGGGSIYPLTHQFQHPLQPQHHQQQLMTSESTNPSRLIAPQTLAPNRRKLVPVDAKFNRVRVDSGGPVMDCFARMVTTPTTTHAITYTGTPQGAAKSRQSSQPLFAFGPSGGRGGLMHHPQQQTQPLRGSPWWPLITDIDEASGSNIVTSNIFDRRNEREPQQLQRQQLLPGGFVPENLRTVLTINTDNDFTYRQPDTHDPPSMPSQSRLDFCVRHKQSRIPESQVGTEKVDGFADKRGSGLFDDLSDALNSLTGSDGGGAGCGVGDSMMDFGGFVLSPLCSPSLSTSEEFPGRLLSTVAPAGSSGSPDKSSSAPVSIPYNGRSFHRPLTSVGVIGSRQGVSDKLNHRRSADFESFGGEPEIGALVAVSATSVGCAGGPPNGAFADSAFNSATPTVSGGFASSFLVTADSPSPLSRASEQDSALVLSEGLLKDSDEVNSSGNVLDTSQPTRFPASYGHIGITQSSQRVGSSRCVSSFPSGFLGNSPPCSHPLSGHCGMSTADGVGTNTTMADLNGSFGNLPLSPLLMNSPLSNPGWDAERPSLRRDFEETSAKLKEACQKLEVLSREHSELLQQVVAASGFIRQLINLLSAFITRRTEAVPGGEGAVAERRGNGLSEADQFATDLLQSLLACPIVRCLLLRADESGEASILTAGNGAPSAMTTGIYSIGGAAALLTPGKRNTTVSVSSRKSSSNLSGIWSTGGGVLEELEEEETACQFGEQCLQSSFMPSADIEDVTEGAGRGSREELEAFREHSFGGTVESHSNGTGKSHHHNLYNDHHSNHRHHGHRHPQLQQHSCTSSNLEPHAHHQLSVNDDSTTVATTTVEN